MAVQVRSSTTPSASSWSGGTTQSVSKPSGVAQYDLLIMAIHGSSGAATQMPLPPADWLPVRGGGINGDNNIQLYAKEAGASEPSAYNLTVPDTGGFGVGIVALYSDTAQRLRIDAVAAQYNASGDRVYPSVDFSAAGLLACFGGIGNASSTPPGGMTERWDVSISASRIYLMTGSVGGAGASGTRAATGTSTISRCVSVAVVEGTPDSGGARYRDHGTGVSGNVSAGNSFAVGSPTELAAGDLLLLAIMIDDTRPLMVSGFDVVVTAEIDSGDQKFHLYQKTAEAGDLSTTYSVTVAGSGSVAYRAAAVAFMSDGGRTLRIGEFSVKTEVGVTSGTSEAVTAASANSCYAILVGRGTPTATQYEIDSQSDTWERVDIGGTGVGRIGLFVENRRAAGAATPRAFAPSSAVSCDHAIVSFVVEEVRSGILVDGVDIEPRLTSWRLEANVRAASATVLTSEDAEQLPTVADWLFTCSGLWSVAIDNVLGALVASNQAADTPLFVEIRDEVVYESETAFVARYKAPIATIDGLLLFEATIGISGAPERTEL